MESISCTIPNVFRVREQGIVIERNGSGLRAGGRGPL